MKIENLGPQAPAPRPGAPKKADGSFSAVLGGVMAEKARAKTNAGLTGMALKWREPAVDVRGAEEPEHKYCSMCGSMLDEKGNCPLCVVPVFISGKEPSDQQYGSRTEGPPAQAAGAPGVLVKPNKIGRKN